jgi:hypothetical protein
LISDPDTILSSDKFEVIHKTTGPVLHEDLEVFNEILAGYKNQSVSIDGRTPWCEVAGSSDMMTLTNARAVAWETCQCRPVAVLVTGIAVKSMTKFRTARKKF